MQYNKMCLDCKHLHKPCAGTTSQAWTGCLLKDKSPEEAEKYINTMEEAYKEAKKK